MTQIEEKIVIKIGLDEYIEVGCKKGEHFYKPMKFGNKIIYPCDKCPHLLREYIERSLFGIGGNVGGSIFKQMEDKTRIRKIEKIYLRCNRFNNLEKLIDF